MDVADGFYQVGLASLTLVSAGSQLLAVMVLTSGPFAGSRVRRWLAVLAVLILTTDHLFIWWQGAGFWRAIFLGIDRVGDKEWLLIGIDRNPGGKRNWFWATFFAITFTYVMIIAILIFLPRPWRTELRPHFHNQ
jgi:hypothetical protein